MSRLLNWLLRGRLERNLQRELHYHLQRRIADLHQSGLPEQEARRQAARELGGVLQIQEEVRDVWLSRWLRDFFYDLRFSARSFLHARSFTATVLLSLALGIGATTAIYSLVDQVLLHALPVNQPEQLVLVDWHGEQAANGFGSWNLMSYPICRDLQQQTEFFQGVFCRALTDVNLSSGGDSQPSTAEIVSGSYFPVLGVHPLLGRLFADEDDGTLNANAVVVVSYRFWKTQLGGAADVLGRKLLVNQHPMTVVGVAAAGFEGIDVGQVPSVWIPAAMSQQVIPAFNSLLDRRMRWMQVLGRLQPGMKLQQAQVGLQPWFKAMLQEDSNRAGFPQITPERRRLFFNSSLILTPAPQGHSSLRRRMSQPLWVLFAVTLVLLSLACLNVASLFLARGSARERELSTRLALGASSGRIARQLLTDSLLMALVGGVLGTALAPLAVRTLIAFLPRDSANALNAGIDSRLLLFAFAASLAAGLLSGFAPALQAGRRSFVSSLRERGGTAHAGVRLRKIIVTAQIALSLILVIGAALFVRTLDALMTRGPGFTTTSIVSFGLDPLRSGYSVPAAARLMRKVDEEIRQSPSTQTSAIARFALLTGGSWNHLMTIQADQRIATDREVNLNAISPQFFQTLGIKMIAGRNFDQRDAARAPGENSTRSAIVNQAFVKRYLPGRNPLGVRVCQGAGPNDKPDIEVVGVVSDFSYRGLREESEQAFFPFFEGDGSSGNFYVKVRGTPDQAFRSLRTIVHNADAALPMTGFRTLNEQLDRSLITEHLMATLSGSFGTLALLLSLVGLYGVMSFVVTQRTREIGIRLALGAKRSSTLWLVLRDALAMILSGVAIGLPVVFVLGHLVESQLYQVKSSDPAAIITAVLFLGLAAFSAALIPAHRASTVNPTDALRID